jgi:hypothetical protein
MAEATTAPNSPFPAVGIISFGDMGSGLARLLIAHGFTIVTNCEGRRFGFLIFWAFIFFFVFDTRFPKE